MAQASRRNRRPRVCPECEPTPPPATMTPVNFAASGGDTFGFLDFDIPIGGAVKPLESLVHPPTLTINGVDEPLADIQPNDIMQYVVGWNTFLNPGDHLVLTIPADCFAFVGPAGEFTTPAVFDITLP